METETAGKHVVKYSLLINTGIRHICHTVIDKCPAALKKWLKQYENKGQTLNMKRRKTKLKSLLIFI